VFNAGVKTPPANASASAPEGTTDMLRLVESLSEGKVLGDVDIVTKALGVSVKPEPVYFKLEGHDELDYTLVVPPIAFCDDCGITVSYRVYNLNGKSAHISVHESRVASIRFNLNPNRVCLTREIVEERLGSARLSVGTDNGRHWWVWDGRSLVYPYFTLVNLLYKNGPMIGCADELRVGLTVRMGKNF
jgi:hypothetical protein